MEIKTDFFQCLPDEVTQLIFSRIRDFKTLIQCMSVSKLFRQQAVRVSSLSIVCPGNFSSYDERLHRVFAMVKAFRNLKSLVVRVGQPRDERPSWARCMRYAEIGDTVEKFIFMAAKRGDFSQLDSTLLGFTSLDEKPQENYSLGTSWWPSVHTDVESKDRLERTSKCMGFVSNKDKAIERGLSKGVLSADSNQMQQGKCLISVLDASTKMKPLSQFSLHQVIAPSNDVLQRMLPVIHFAIVQGLNELRDSLPAFVAQFTELRSFLLVDMVESITVFVREHHIQELRSSYLQELNELPDLVEGDSCKGDSLVDVHFNDNVIGGKLANGKDEEKYIGSRSKKSGNFEVLDFRCINGVQRTEDLRSGHDGTGNRASSSNRNINGLECNPSNIVSTHHFKAFDSQSLQVSNNKGKFEESDSERAPHYLKHKKNNGNIDICDSQSSQASNNKEKYEEFDSEPEPHHLKHNNHIKINSSTGNGQDDWGGECSYGPIGSPRAHSRSLHGNLSVRNTIDARLRGFDVTRNERLISPEPLTELTGSVDLSLDHQGDYLNKLTSNGHRLQSNRCIRNPKPDLTSKCSSLGCFKPDIWRKKDCKTRHFLTGFRGRGGPCCSNVLEENLDVKGSITRLSNYTFTNEMPLGHGNDDESCVPSIESRIDDILPGTVDDCTSSSNNLALAVDSPEGNEHQSSNNVPMSSQARQSETSEIQAERLFVDGIWQDRMQSPRNSLHVDDHNFDVNQHRRGHRTQSLELNAPVAVEGSNHADFWRHVWQERVRKLRESLHMSSGQELDRTLEWRRERLMDLGVRKRHKSVEKDALSFDYTFWKAEQVSSCECVVSDVSICIATHEARPLRDFEKEALKQAAIAGPLLVATVSHANNHHTSHLL